MDAEQIMAQKRADERKFHGITKTRSGVTKSGIQTRDKDKAKKAKASRKKNRRNK